MIPKKLFLMLGYNNLSFILEQERKHWLMKTDEKKQIQDKATGALFQGQIDNIGSDIIIESEKLPYKYDFITDITFNSDAASKILSINNCAFPHSAMVNGLMFARIISTNYSLDNFGVNYKIKFTGAEKCIIPFAGSTESSEVFADRWIRTTNPPIIMCMDESGQYTISEELSFSDTVTNAVYYYPLSETLQPLGITDIGNGEYELNAVDNDTLIGYPLFWFTCDQSNVGSNLTFENNVNNKGEQYFFVSNEGNASKFNAKVYVGLDGDTYGTPDSTTTSNYSIKCSCKSSESFNNSNADYNKSIDPNSIYLVNNSTQTSYQVNFICNENDKITMNGDIPWTYVDNSTYEIEMSYFDQNVVNDNRSNTALVSVFNIHFDESIPFVKTTTDVGFAGVRMGSSTLYSDIYDRYPKNINKWEGLPQWMNDLDEGMNPAHLVMYAFHQPPAYNQDDPESMQGGAIIIDPGLTQQSEPEIDENGEPIIDNDTIGRVYVVSNDDLAYKNNATETYPKPPRTAARICDIPTSVMQLTGVTGLSPDPIVDSKYVRTEASYSEDDKNRLINEYASRWVRPTALNSKGIPVYEDRGYPDKFAFAVNIFPDGTVLNTLNDVDLIDHNDFRYHININPMVDVSKISIANIYEPGKDYVINDMGVCVIGGYSFVYIVEEVDTNGGVTKLGLVPDDRASSINLSNFNMSDGLSGISDTYGTSPTSGNGIGLKIKFKIDYDYYQSIIESKGEIFDDLFALVKERTGLYVYQYKIDTKSIDVPKRGKWVKGQCISEYETTSIQKANGGVSTQESYINSIIPSVRNLPITVAANNEETTTINVLQTSSFINVIDKVNTPVKPANTSNDESNKTIVDLCKFYCEGFQTAIAETKSIDGIKNKLKELNMLRFDSYVLWRWLDPAVTTNKNFEYGIVTRGFNNLFTTDEITMIPTNELNCDNFVHTNGNTTIVWDVEGVGPMMWIYDPTYTKKESYWIDPSTMELHVTRTEMSYEDIDIRMPSNGNGVPQLIKNGLYMYNVMTNNPICVETSVDNPIYQQPEMTQLTDVVAGGAAINTSDKHKLCGNWRLVFPRVQSYRLMNDATGTSWTPIKMQIIKGRSISDVGTVFDSFGNDVNMKSLVIDEGKEKIQMKMFNSNTGQWEII